MSILGEASNLTSLSIDLHYTGSFKELNDKNPFPWGIPHYYWSDMAYNTFEHISGLNFECANETLLHRWIGRAVSNDQHFLLWPPRSPDLTPCDFFLWGYVKDNAYKPPLPSKCAWTARWHSSCGANRWWEHVEARLAGVKIIALTLAE